MFVLGVAREEGSGKLHTTVQRGLSPLVQSQLCPSLEVLVVSSEEALVCLGSPVCFPNISCLRIILI